MESSSYMPYSSSAVEQEQGQEQPSPFYQVPAVSSSAMGGGGGYDELRKEQQQEDLEEQTPFQSIPDDDDEQIQIPFQREADMDDYLPPPIPTALPTLDMSSSSTSHGGFEPSTPSSPGGFGGFTPASPTSALLSSDLTSNATPRDRSFSRESAPAPETPVPAAGLPSSFRHQPYSPHHSAPPPPPQEPLHAPGDPDAFTYNPYAPSHYTTTRAAPTPSSPPTEDAFPNSSRRAKVGAGARGDLSVLLGGGGGEGSPGKGKGKEREKKGGGNLLGKGGKVGTLGRGKKGQGALAALLGMEEEERKEESKKEVKEAQKEDEEVKVKKEEEEVKKEEKEEPVAEPAPLPPSSPAVAAPSPLAHLALDTPLPPSRGASPPPASSSSAPSSPSKTSQHSSKPSLDRTASLAPSLSVGYDALVSPLETGETPRADTGTEGDGEKAWPENKAVALEEEGSEKEKEGEKEEDGTAKIDEKLAALKVADEEEGTNPTPAKPEDVTLPSPSSASAEEPLPPSSSAPESPFSSTADLPPSSSTTTADTPSDPTYQQYIFSSSSSPPPSISTSTDSAPPRSENGTISSTRGFRTFNDTEEDDGEGFGGLGGGGRVGEADSLRGTYSRSLEEEQEGEEEGESTPTTERTEGFGGGGFGGEAQGQAVQRVQREGSAPLPPLPASISSIQGSPRSSSLGGSLGPSFVITVGDPQTVGSAINLAAQHTVYTVRTRTTSSAFRKNDFAVLRRYSHFVWLYEALLQNNPGVIVPGMPEKHAIGRFGSTFVENRRLGLQTALNKIVSHPMLMGDPDLRLFLESDTFHIDIKQRKIDPASAENKGFLANLSSSISGPKFIEHDPYFDERKQQLDIFETQLRSLLTSLSSAAKARSTLSSSIAELESAFLALTQCDLSSTLRKLMNQAAEVQRKIHDLAEQQSAGDEVMGGLVSVVESYARLCASAKGVFGARIKAFHAYQAAEANFRKLQAAHEKAKKAGRTHSELLNLSVAEIAEAERRMLDAQHDFDDVSKLTKAEMARVDKEKVDDFKRALEEYADSLAARQRQVVEAWQQYHDLLVKAVEANAAPPPPSSSSAAVDES